MGVIFNRALRPPSKGGIQVKSRLRSKLGKNPGVLQKQEQLVQRPWGRHIHWCSQAQPGRTERGREGESGRILARGLRKTWGQIVRGLPGPSEASLLLQ